MVFVFWVCFWFQLPSRFFSFHPNVEQLGSSCWFFEEVSVIGLGWTSRTVPTRKKPSSLNASLQFSSSLLLLCATFRGLVKAWPIALLQTVQTRGKPEPPKASQSLTTGEDPLLYTYNIKQYQSISYCSSVHWTSFTQPQTSGQSKKRYPSASCWRFEKYRTFSPLFWVAMSDLWTAHESPRGVLGNSWFSERQLDRWLGSFMMFYGWFSDCLMLNQCLVLGLLIALRSCLMMSLDTVL